MAPPTPASDEQLVASCQAEYPSGTTAFAALVERHQTQVYRSCVHYLGNEANAQDATQEVFLRVFHGLQRFEGRSKFTTWLYRIVFNVCSTIRRQERHVPTEPEVLEALSEPEPEDTRLEQHDLLTDAMAQVSDKEREVLTLRYVAGHSFEDISEILQIKLSAAKMRTYRAEQHLRAIIENRQKGEASK